MSEEKKPRRRRPFRWLRRLLATAALLAVAAVALRFGAPELFRRLFAPRQEITVVTVERRLSAIGELATYAMEYSGYTEEESARSVFGVKVPGTRHAVKIAYSGTIKAGYEIADIAVRVDAGAGVIHIALPEVKIISNAIDEDSLKYVERNNIFNPIKGDAAAQYLDDIRKKELDKAVEMGLYEKAEENAQAIIAEKLADYRGWTVAFD